MPGTPAGHDRRRHKYHCLPFDSREKTALAQQLYRHDNVWRLPPLWQHEFLNVVATFIRQGGGTREDGYALWRRAVSLLTAVETEVALEAALTLALKHGISAYNAQFVALAQALDVPLVTEDRGLLAACGETAVSIKDFLPG